MNGKALAGAAAVAALLAAGCGSTAAQPASVGSVASALHITGIQHESPELFVKDEATGTMGGTPVRVYVFRTGEAKANWVKAANSFGGVDTVNEGSLFLVVKSP